MKQAARKAHRRIWTIFGILLPGILLVGLYFKQTVPIERTSVQLEKAEEGWETKAPEQMPTSDLIKPLKDDEAE